MNNGSNDMTPELINKYNNNGIQVAITIISNYKQYGIFKHALDNGTIDRQSKFRNLSREQTIEQLEAFDNENELLIKELISLLPELFNLRDGKNEIGKPCIEGFTPSYEEYEWFKGMLEDKIVIAEQIQIKYRFWLFTTSSKLRIVRQELTGCIPPFSFLKLVDGRKTDLVNNLIK